MSEEMSEVLPCIRCDKPLDCAVPGERNQPCAGTSFYTKGHYGSTIFDPMDGSWIEVNICDDCLTRQRDKGFVLFYQDRDTCKIWTTEG